MSCNYQLSEAFARAHPFSSFCVPSSKLYVASLGSNGSHCNIVVLSLAVSLPHPRLVVTFIILSLSDLILPLPNNPKYSCVRTESNSALQHPSKDHEGALPTLLIIPADVS